MGGEQIHCQISSEMAVEIGHSVKIITTRHPRGLEYKQQKGINIYYLLNTRSARLSKSWWKESVNKITQLHEDEPFDVIWAENLAGYYYAWKIKPQLKIPIVSVMHQLGLLGHIVSEWNRISSFKEIISFSAKHLPEALLFYIPWFFRTLKYSDAIVGVSDQTIEALRREFLVDENKLFVIYDGIDTELFKPDKAKREFIRKQFSINQEDKVILMAGVIHKQKGMHFGLRAFAQIRKQVQNCKLIVLGDGPHLEELKELAGELDVDKDVIFCGLIPNDETAAYYNGCDLFLNPTVRQEGLALVTLEAMSCAKPVVVSRIGGTQSTIDDGISGFFVRPKDIESITKKTIELLRNQTLSNRMGEKGREKVLIKFSREKMIADYLSISERLIK